MRALALGLPRQLKSHNRVLSLKGTAHQHTLTPVTEVSGARILARTPRVFAQAGYDLLQLGHLRNTTASALRSKVPAAQGGRCSSSALAP